MAVETFKVGVISDTHGHMDPRVKEIFEQARVDHIIHAGDIGLPFLILDLEDIAPVTAVLGNVDQGINYKDTEMVELRGRKFLVHHTVAPKAPRRLASFDAIRNRGSARRDADARVPNHRDE